MYRMMNEGDRNFITNSFLKSLKNIQFKDMPSRFFFNTYNKIIDDLLINATVLIDCDDEEPSLIKGYVIFELNDPTIHFIFTKYLYRNMKIATGLMKEIGFLDKKGFKISHKNLIYDIYKSRFNYIYKPLI